MGNRTSGGGGKLPLSKIADTDTGELELEPPLALASSASRAAQKQAHFHERVICEVVRGSMDRDEGLGQLAFLPDECILNVLSFLAVCDIGSASCASRALFLLGRDDALWKHIYRRSTRLLTEMRLAPHSPRQGAVSIGGNRGGRGGGGGGSRALSSSVSSTGYEEEDISFNFVKDAKGRQRRKERKGGKWKAICRLNYVRLPASCAVVRGGGVILTEQLLGWSLDRINELLGTCDEVTPVGRNGAYYYYHSPGLAVCFEDDRSLSSFVLVCVCVRATLTQRAPIDTQERRPF